MFPRSSYWDETFSKKQPKNDSLIEIIAGDYVLEGLGFPIHFNLPHAREEDTFRTRELTNGRLRHLKRACYAPFTTERELRGLEAMKQRVEVLAESSRQCHIPQKPCDRQVGDANTRV